jgi:SAM-dependent methyltransferase
MTEERKSHWEGVYRDKHSTEVSWFQEVPDKSLALVVGTGTSQKDAILDVGGGASTLVDHLLDAGYVDITVLDLASKAFDQSRQRLGERASAPSWVVSDITRFEPQRKYRLWHDRAVLHFLTDPEDRRRYMSVLKQALDPGGHVVIAAFGPEGPPKCSGLEIRRYTIEMLAELLGPEFELQSHELENHQTPMGATQQFLYSRWTRRG